MNLFSLLGAIEVGFLFGIAALGVYLSFRVLNFPDITVDGSFTLGGAVAATLIVAGVDPVTATVAAALAGAAAGVVTAALAVYLRILHLFAGILTMIALYSINLRIMGAPNLSLLGRITLFSFTDHLPWPSYQVMPVLFLILAVLFKLLVDRLLVSNLGLALRATGANPRMVAAQGGDTRYLTLFGMAVSNGLVGLAGALWTQDQGNADVTMGVGLVVVGLAAVILGEGLTGGRGIARGTLGCLLGSLVYRLVVAMALDSDVLGLKSQDLNLVTAVLVVVAMVVAERRGRLTLFRSGAR
ncbi:MAG: ABC transporter permease [Azospirillaceae bacterium]|nr:ABC transporter permease [Azospirillaceae bacterium]